MFCAILVYISTQKVHGQIPTKHDFTKFLPRYFVLHLQHLCTCCENEAVKTIVEWSGRLDYGSTSPLRNQ